MNLYTFIMDYIGGTYVSQVEAVDKEHAREIWIKKLEVDEIKFFTNEDKKNIIEDNFYDEIMVPLKGLESVWFFLVKTKKGNGYVNVIKTKL